jgi:pyruvate/2-oxoglutarate dehydrogenase complex dihydrolipoamide acyltransferase (E2) component
MSATWPTRLHLGMLTLVVVGCGEKPSTTAPSAVSPVPSAAASPAVAASTPVASATAVPSPAPSVVATAAPSAVPSAPLPAVQVSNIGLHIGGGPNDAVTKEPVLKSVEPHFEAFRACFASADDPKKGGDFGVDLLIEGAGGLAKVTHPRTIIGGDAFRSCVVGVFEKISFQKPKGGRTMASYSLHFTPR